MSLSDDIHILNAKEIYALVKDVVSLSRSVLQNKTNLLSHLDVSCPDDLKRILREAAFAKKRMIEAKADDRKRKRADVQWHRRMERKIADEDQLVEASSVEFLHVPSEEVVKECYRQFYDATSSRALVMAVCAVCAREVDLRDTQIRTLEFQAIPNAHRLRPRTPHPAHDIYKGMLLDPKGVTRSGKKAKICNECFEDMKKESPHSPPLSLANDLWIGRVPWELETLSFAEQQLIGQLFPRVYVFKLWPASMDFNLERETLQRGLRGNVCTFELDHAGIVTMISGKKMPRPPDILASIIMITIVGHGKLPKHVLRSLFRVRRRAVYLALLWLKANNRHYADIIIDQVVLSDLPEDDVPDELIQVIRQNEDTGIVEEERSGYANHDADETELDTQSGVLSGNEGLSKKIGTNVLDTRICGY